MISFENDYNVGAHPKILQELIKANQCSSYSGYGQDEYCARAKEKNKKSLQLQRCRYILFSRRNAD